MRRVLFSGSGVALVTPFTREGVDFPLYERLIDRQIAAGTKALIPCGTTGEPSTMTEDERDDTVRCAVERASGRIPVIAGAGGNCTRDVVARCARCEKLGADALLVVTPYYNKATQSGLIAHFEAVADAVSIPIILYNVPSRTGVNMLPETVLCLAEKENIVGLKEACPDISQVSEVSRLTEGRIALYSGNDEHALAAMALGALGVISVTANICPELVREMTDAFFAGDVAKARKIHFQLSNLTSLLFSEVSPIPAKAALRMMGLGDGLLRLPLTDMDEGKARLLEAELLSLGLI